MDIQESLKKFSHDIRTPLTTIETGAYALKEFLPILINSYQQNNAPDLTIQQLDSLKTIANNLEASVLLIYAQVDKLQRTISNYQGVFHV